LPRKAQAIVLFDRSQETFALLKFACPHAPGVNTVSLMKRPASWGLFLGFGVQRETPPTPFQIARFRGGQRRRIPAAPSEIWPLEAVWPLGAVGRAQSAFLLSQTDSAAKKTFFVKIC
jgi:hypothetical protein